MSNFMRALDTATRQAIRSSLDEIERTLIERFRQGGQEESGWLIEWGAEHHRDGQARWFSVRDGWTEDASKALRFCRAEDAVAAYCDSGWFNPDAAMTLKATEHMWLAPADAGRAALAEAGGR